MYGLKSNNIWPPLMAVLSLATLAQSAGAQPAVHDHAQHVQAVETQHADDDLPAGWKIIDGDIMVPEDFDPNQRSTYRINTWTNGTIPFIFDPNVTMNEQLQMLDAMAEWEAIANVNFVPRSGEANYVRVIDAPGNSSPVGMIGGEQVIRIASWDERFIIAHELGHCLGFVHEQTRTDRDTYVTVVPQNVQGGAQGNTFLVNFATDGGSTGYGPYDFDSIMHYDKCAFSTGCPPGTTCACAAGTETILVNQPWTAQWQNAIGQRGHLSYMDRTAMRCMYSYPGDRFLDQNWGGPQSGSFRQPWNVPFASALNATPINGTLLTQPGTYAAVGTYNRPITLLAPIGGVTLRN